MLTFTAGILIQDRKQPRSRSRCSGIAQNDVLVRKRFAVQLFVPVFIRPKRRSLQRNTSEDAARSRVSQNLGVHLGIRFCRRVAPHWSQRRVRVSTNSELTLEQF